MKNTLLFLKLGLVLAWLASSLACGSQNQSGLNSANSSNSSANQTNETAEVNPSPSATPFTFDVDKLLAYTKINQSESEKLIKGKEITVTGSVKHAESGSGMNWITFESKLGEIECSGYMDTPDLKGLRDAVYAQFDSGRKPLATAKGVYKTATINKNGNIDISLEKCELQKYVK